MTYLWIYYTESLWFLKDVISVFEPTCTHMVDFILHQIFMRHFFPIVLEPKAVKERKENGTSCCLSHMSIFPLQLRWRENISLKQRGKIKKKGSGRRKQRFWSFQYYSKVLINRKIYILIFLFLFF